MRVICPAWVAVACVLASCVPLNTVFVLAHEARLDAHTERIVLLEGAIVGLSPAGAAMKAQGHPEVELEFRFPTERETVRGYVMVVPKHMYAGSVARHLVQPEHIDEMPGELTHLVRLEAFEGRVADQIAHASALLQNVPDGDYFVAACDFTKIRSSSSVTGTSRVVTSVRGVYTGEVQVVDGACDVVALVLDESVEDPKTGSPGLNDPTPDPPARPKQNWRSRQFK